MMKLDSTGVWQEASAAIAANREVLLTLAGVFFLLPRLIVGLLAPVPEAQAGMDLEAMGSMMQSYYVRALPWLLPMIVLEAAGTLAMLTLFEDRSRPTVREAIRGGFLGVVPYLAAELIFGFGISFGGGLLLGLAGVSGSKPLAMAVMAVLMAGIFYGFVRLVLLAPVVAVERVRNPLRALVRAWTLPAGNVARLFAMLLLLGMIAVVAMVATVGIGGSLVALVGGADAGKIAATVLEAVLDAVFAVYLVAILAAIHRQLAGAPPAVTGHIFS